MTGVPFGATADGHVVLGFAFGVDAAHSLTGIAAFQIETGLIAVALFVLGAFGKTANEWIAQEILRARAHRAVILIDKISYLVAHKYKKKINSTKSIIIILNLHFKTDKNNLNVEKNFI